MSTRNFIGAFTCIIMSASILVAQEIVPAARDITSQISSDDPAQFALAKIFF